MRTKIWRIVAGLVAMLAWVLWSAVARAQGLDGPTLEIPAYEQWMSLAAFLPILVGLLIGVLVRRGGSTQAQATVAVVVYFGFALIGNWLKGDFTGLSWGSVYEVFTSLILIATTGYASYQTIWKMVPLPQLIEEKVGGDPLVTLIPERNVA